MPLGTEPNAGRPRPRRHCLRWGPSCPDEKGHSSTQLFGPFLLWPNGCMLQDATWYGGTPQPRGLCVRWGPSPLPLNFRPMFIIVTVISLEHCTMYSRYWFVQVQVQVYRKKFNRTGTQSVPLCTVAPHSVDRGSRSCELVAF